MNLPPQIIFPVRLERRAPRRGILLLAVALLGGGGEALAQREPAEMTAAAVRGLAATDVRTGQPVRVRGSITYRDQGWGFMVLQDGSGGVPVFGGPADLPLAIGSQVEIEGVSGVFLGGGGIDRPTVRLLVKGALPPPRPVTIPELDAGAHDGVRVEITGVVSATDVVRDRALLHLHDGTNHLDVIVRDLSPADPALPRLVGAQVRVRGANCRAILPGSRKLRPFVLAAGTNDLTLLRAAPGSPFDGPTTAIRDLAPTNGSERVKIFARVQSGVSNGYCLLADDTGTIRARVERGTQAYPDDVAEVAGFPSTSHRETILDHAVFRLLARPEPQSGPATNRTGGTNHYLPVLQSIAALRRLAPEEADRGFPARLRGVVTFYDERAQYLFLHDGTNGIFAWPPSGGLRVAVGEIVELSGFTGAGRYSPILCGGRVRKLGAGELPPPRALPFARLLSGQHDCDWVAMDGIVRAVELWDGRLLLNVAAVGGTFTAVIASTNLAAGAALVDAEVRFHGVCGTEANNRRQLTGVKIFVPSLASVIVREPPAAEPFALPERTVASLLSFQPAEKAGHRVRVRGVVTMRRASGAVYLRDGTAPARIELLQPGDVQPGDVVEAAGFPELTGQSVRLLDAVHRRVGSASLPAPLNITPSAAAGVEHDAERVSAEARLLTAPPRPGQPLILQSARGFVFEATVAQTNGFAALQNIPPGSLLRLTGICSSRGSEAGGPRSFRLLLGSAADVAVLQRTPWWTPRHALTLGGSLAALVLAALAWAWLLRRQVRKQTADIRELNTGLERRVAERTAELEAANRELESFSYSVSHDLRAPLRAVNGFAEILLQNHAPQLDEKGTKYLRHVADGGRRMDRLVGDLLAFSRLTRQPLAKAALDLNGLVAPIIEELRGQEPQRRVAVRVQPLPPAEGDRALVHQVFYNLLANAWKFTARRADAEIEIGSLTNGSGPVYFVKDNGAGFDMRYADKLFGVFQRLHRDDEFPGTGVGLALVQRIIQRHGGRIWAEGKPGEGAVFYFTLPAGSPKTEACSAFGK